MAKGADGNFTLVTDAGGITDTGRPLQEASQDVPLIPRARPGAALRSGWRSAPLAMVCSLLLGAAFWLRRPVAEVLLRAPSHSASVTLSEKRGRFVVHEGLNCVNGHGADAFGDENGAEGEIDGKTNFTLRECKRECLERMPTCEGFIVITDGSTNRCWLRTNIHAKGCYKGTPYNLWAWNKSASALDEMDVPEEASPRPRTTESLTESTSSEPTSETSSEPSTTQAPTDSSSKPSTTESLTESTSNEPTSETSSKPLTTQAPEEATSKPSTTESLTKVTSNEPTSESSSKPSTTQAPKEALSKPSTTESQTESTSKEPVSAMPAAADAERTAAKRSRVAYQSTAEGSRDASSLWPVEAEGMLCRRRDMHTTVHDQGGCQALCGEGCVGISYSTGERLSQYCYLCLDDELIPSANDFHFYRKAVAGQGSPAEKQLKKSHGKESSEKNDIADDEKPLEREPATGLQVNKSATNKQSSKEKKPADDKQQVDAKLAKDGQHRMRSEIRRPSTTSKAVEEHSSEERTPKRKRADIKDLKRFREEELEKHVDEKKSSKEQKHAKKERQPEHGHPALHEDTVVDDDRAPTQQKLREAKRVKETTPAKDAQEKKPVDVELSKEKQLEQVNEAADEEPSEHHDLAQDEQFEKSKPAEDEKPNDDKKKHGRADDGFVSVVEAAQNATGVSATSVGNNSSATGQGSSDAENASSTEVSAKVVNATALDGSRKAKRGAASSKKAGSVRYPEDEVRFLAGNSSRPRALNKKPPKSQEKEENEAEDEDEGDEKNEKAKN